MKTFAELKEKTLTNAEKRKREEIARAMERENPDMDMDKKMAIATATAKRVAEADEKDPEEYDNEGSMMKGQLRQICSASEKLMKMVKDEDNLPEWVQSKVTKATDYIRSVRDYLESEKMADTNESMMVKDKSADKKPEIVTLPTGKRVVRMVPTQKKQVADNIDELSTNTLSNYMVKSTADAGKRGATARTQDKRIGGQKMADNKLRSKK